MDNNEIIARLQALGPLPDAHAPAMDTYPLEEFDELLQQLIKPLTPVQSLALINLGPPNGTGAYGLEWSLVHTAESVTIAELRDILLLADDTAVRSLMEIRMANYLENNPK